MEEQHDEAVWVVDGAPPYHHYESASRSGHDEYRGRGTRQNRVLKASDVIGMKVEGTDGKSLGKIKDLVLDPDEGDVQYAVLDFGGFLGIKDKYFIVPWEAINFNPKGTKIVLDVSKRDLKNAPGFDKNHWPDFSDQQQQVMIYEFYEIPLPQGEKQREK